MALPGTLSSGPGTKYSHGTQSKDLPVCDEIAATVNQFKSFLAEQKKLREELLNFPNLPLVKLKEELTSVMHQVSYINSDLRRTSTRSDRLKEEMLKEEKYIGVAQRLSESGASAQMESTVITEYFSNKLADFDSRMRSCKQELEALEQQITSRSFSQLTPKDLVNLLRQMDDKFIALASQLHTAYEQVRVLKTRYIRNQRTVSGDNYNPFAEVEASIAKLRQLNDVQNGTFLSGVRKLGGLSTAYGPSPFSATCFTSSFPLVSANTNQIGVNSAPQPTGFSLAPSVPATNTSVLAPGFSLFGQQPGAVTTIGTVAPFQFGTSTSAGQTPLFNFGAASSTGPTAPGTLSLSNQLTSTQPFTFGFGSGGNLFGRKLS